MMMCSQCVFKTVSAVCNFYRSVMWKSGKCEQADYGYSSRTSSDVTGSSAHLVSSASGYRVSMYVDMVVIVGLLEGPEEV